MTRTLSALALVFLISGCGGAESVRDPAPRAAHAAVPAVLDSGGPDAAAAATTADGGPAIDAVTVQIHQEANAVREIGDLGALSWSDDLAALAQAHSLDMAARGYFAHNTPEGRTPAQRASTAGVECRSVSENLYRTGRWSTVTSGPGGEVYDWLTPTEVAQRVVVGWLDSPAHRENLLNASSSRHGIGVAREGDNLFVTQVLC